MTRARSVRSAFAITSATWRTASRRPIGPEPAARQIAVTCAAVRLSDMSRRPSFPYRAPGGRGGSSLRRRLRLAGRGGIPVPDAPGTGVSGGFFAFTASSRMSPHSVSGSSSAFFLRAMRPPAGVPCRASYSRPPRRGPIRRGSRDQVLRPADSCLFADSVELVARVSSGRPGPLGRRGRGQRLFDRQADDGGIVVEVAAARLQDCFVNHPNGVARRLAT